MSISIKKIIVSGILFANWTIVSAEQISFYSDNRGIVGRPSINFLGAYTNFNFNSVAGINYNRYQGYSKLLSIGGGNIKIGRRTILGLSLFRIQTNVNSELFLSPGVPGITMQKTNNSTVFAHALRQYSKTLFFDLAGSYGQNHTNNQSFITLSNTTAQQYGYGNSSSNNWYVSLAGIYAKPVKKFLFNTNARLLFSQINAGGYLLTYQSIPTQLVAPLTNKVIYLLENVELGYNVDPQRIPLTPFINAGLQQVLLFQNSRPVIDAPVNGTSPQLNLDQNGYRLGGGISFTHKQLSVRLEEQYFNAAGTFISYQTLLGLRYQA